jgi:dihydroorotase
MSKFVSLGVPVPDVIRMATSAPARAIGRPELGALTVGGIGDAAVLELQTGEFNFVDARGVSMVGRQRLVSHGIVVGGKFLAADVP